MTHAVLIDPNQNVLKEWIQKTGMPAIHVSKNYNAGKWISLPFEGLGRVNVSHLYGVKEMEDHDYIRPTYADYDPTVKSPLIVPLYGIQSISFLAHVLDDLLPRLKYAVTEPNEIAPNECRDPVLWKDNKL